MALACMQALIGLPDGPTICYLRLHYFSSEGTRAVIDALNMAEYWGVEGFIVDLRNNPGTVSGYSCMRFFLRYHNRLASGYHHVSLSVCGG